MTWDHNLLTFVNQAMIHPILDWLSVAATLGAMPIVVLLPCILMAAGKRREGKALLIVLAISLSGTLGMQFLLRRLRPENVRLFLPQPITFSFPSGHAASVFAYATFYALARRRIGIAAWLGAIAISLSRVYLGHHYPSDILGGAILGSAAGAMGFGLCYQRVTKRRPSWGWLVWGQMAIVALASMTAYLGLLEVGILDLPYMDKTLHFVLFGALAFTAVGWFARLPPTTTLLALGLLATLEESAQILSAARSFDLLDLAATLLGILFFGWLGARARYAHRSRRNQGTCE